MDHFAGLDVSVKETSICVVDDTGRIVREVKVASEPVAVVIRWAQTTGTTSAILLKTTGLCFHTAFVTVPERGNWAARRYAATPTSPSVHRSCCGDTH